MNVARFIARRYFKAKKTTNVINLITKISVVGIMVSTAALVILLSAFNGIEQMVINLYTDFDTSLTVQSAKSKTFDENFIDLPRIEAVEGVNSISRAIEEVVILKNENKWVHAKMIGVDTTFLEMSNMRNHIVDGVPLLYIDDEPQAIFGAVLLDKLGGYISVSEFFQKKITFNVPLREGKIRPGKQPLNTRLISASARMNFNREVNAENVVVPYELASELLEYGNDITALYIDVDDKANLKRTKKRIEEVVGDDFEVKTNFEKNELIFKTSQTERLIVYFILIFIFILASFNLVASIVMLFVEKKNDINTLYSLGANKQLIFNIFFYEGLLIVGRGVVVGLIIGYVTVYAQIYFGIIAMPSIPGESFPMFVKWQDALVILLSVGFLGFVVSYFPTKMLVNRHISVERG